MLLIGAMLGCGSDRTIPVNEFAKQYDLAACGMMARHHMVSDQAYCIDLVAAAYRVGVGFNSLAAHVAAVNAGKSTFDARRAAECIAALDGASFDARSMAGVRSTCTGLFVGALGDGAACIADGECGRASRCQPQIGSDCAGVCTPLGSTCVYDSQCPNGQVCEVSSSSCVDVKPAGANGQACGANNSCQSGLSCSNGGCQPSPTEGQPCADLACAEGLICAVLGNFPGYGICSRVHDKGEPCQWPGECGGMFFSALTCDPTLQICVDGFIGGPCVPPWGGFSFESFLGLQDRPLQVTAGCNALISYCEHTTAVCMAYTPLGAACTTSSSCELAGYCRPDALGATTGICAPIPNCSP